MAKGSGPARAAAALAAALGWAAFADAPPGAPPAAPRVAAELTGRTADADQAVVHDDGAGVAVDIRSPGGIGRVRLTPAAGAWPGRIVLRLHLRTLEGITFRQGELEIRAASRATRLTASTAGGAAAGARSRGPRRRSGRSGPPASPPRCRSTAAASRSTCRATCCAIRGRSRCSGSTPTARNPARPRRQRGLDPAARRP